MSSIKSRFQARRRQLNFAEPALTAPLVAMAAQPQPKLGAQVDIAELRLIKISGAGFFREPTGATARSLFQRAFGAPEVGRVSIDAARGEVEIGYSVSARDPEGQLQRLAEQLRNPGPLADLPGSFGRGAGARVRLQRYGKTLSGWAVKHEIEGRIRFENPVLLRRRALRQGVEAELVNAFGVDKFSIQELTGTVLIHFNPRQIQKRQLVALLDAALEKTEDFALAPIDYDLPVLDNALRYCGVRARPGVLRALRQPVSRLKLRSEQRKTMRQRGH